MKLVTCNPAKKLAIILVSVMLLSTILPAYGGVKFSNDSVCISSFTDSTGSLNINAGRGEGIKVGAKGVIIRDDKEIAKYTVEQVNWGFSKISIHDLVKGEVIHAGDRAPITDMGSGKSKSKSKLWKTLGIAALVTAAILLLRNHGSDSSSSSSSITLKAEKTTSSNETSTITITATVRDSNGDLVIDGTIVNFSTTAGTLNHTITTTTGGNATATLTGDIEDGSAVVTAKSSGQTATINVSFTASIDLSASPSTIQITNGGGSETQSTITATCKDAYGNLATSGTVEFSTSVGTITDEATISNGVATATLTSSAAGTATVTAKWSSTTATTTVEITAGPPYTITLSGASTLSCDGNSSASITATVKDIGGNSVTNGTVVDFSVTPDGSGGGNGTITAQATTSNGVATAYLYSKDSSGATSKSGTATVKAEVLVSNQPDSVPAPSSDLSNTTTVKFVSSEVGKINLGASIANIRGLDTVGNTTNLTAVVTDTDNNAVPDGTVVTFTATHGMISNVTTTTNGTATATLTSDAPGGDGIVDVTATAGGVSTTASGLVIFSGAPSAANCSASISPDTLAKSGGQAVVTVNALDINSHPLVDGTVVTAATSKGTISPTSGETSGGIVTFTVATSIDSVSPTEPGAGAVTITIPSGNSSQPVTLTVSFTVSN
jgi:hypothetical protein